MKKVVILFIVIAASCVPKSDNISESEVINTLEGFFKALDVENDNPNLLDEYITRDFEIYEAGKKMNKKEFLDFVSGFPIIKTDWQFSDHRISTGVKSAHISLINTGDFILQVDSIAINQQYKWLESAYMVKENDRLKIKFYFSDNISIKSDTIKKL
ncbi:hypothetical protein [Labilibacter marinus]|uniref:hypothetical protein n=1 Tax=Labilibacter marinus TaxID=1477105 RepID=UPI00082A6B5D|nr:hypothetical protein [Labilibacter marinus]